MRNYEFAQNTGFVIDHAEPTVGPDFICEEDCINPVGLEPPAAVAIAKFCQRLFEVGGGRGQRKFYQAAHAACFAAHMHPMQDQPGEIIARRFRITKAAFFKQVNRFRDLLNLPRIAGAKSNQARQHYRKTQTRTHAKRKRQHRNQNGPGISRLLMLADSRARGEDRSVAA